MSNNHCKFKHLDNKEIKQSLNNSFSFKKNFNKTQNIYIKDNTVNNLIKTINASKNLKNNYEELIEVNDIINSLKYNELKSLNKETLEKSIQDFKNSINNKLNENNNNYILNYDNYITDKNKQYQDIISNNNLKYYENTVKNKLDLIRNKQKELLIYNEKNNIYDKINNCGYINKNTNLIKLKSQCLLEELHIKSLSLTDKLNNIKLGLINDKKSKCINIKKMILNNLEEPKYICKLNYNNYLNNNKNLINQIKCKLLDNIKTKTKNENYLYNEILTQLKSINECKFEHEVKNNEYIQFLRNQNNDLNKINLELNNKNNEIDLEKQKLVNKIEELNLENKEINNKSQEIKNEEYNKMHFTKNLNIVNEKNNLRRNSNELNKSINKINYNLKSLGNNKSQKNRLTSNKFVNIDNRIKSVDVSLSSELNSASLISVKSNIKQNNYIANNKSNILNSLNNSNNFNNCEYSNNNTNKKIIEDDSKIKINKNNSLKKLNENISMSIANNNRKDDNLEYFQEQCNVIKLNKSKNLNINNKNNSNKSINTVTKNNKINKENVNNSNKTSDYGNELSNYIKMSNNNNIKLDKKFNFITNDNINISYLTKLNKNNNFSKDNTSIDLNVNSLKNSYDSISFDIAIDSIEEKHFKPNTDFEIYGKPLNEKD